MLETHGLSKIYKPKRGVPVAALSGVDLRFPERGMVFLLGKSGSGKSTLLNLLGGLDRYDSGEIIIKGVSSKDFKQKHFDSYRNTYVGFIFQEYNVLEDFTVGANIALAIELQGRRAGDEEIEEILRQVDLAGYGSRKPSELSGGQKQRVAIARALVKQPEIIMADEPTGALDSATGRQVLETLKRLSAEKLVIVVSHDREFAERYADRIIELSDGKVIRDVEASGEALAPEENALSYDGDTVRVPGGYHLTEADREAINAYLDARASGVTLELCAGQGRRAFVPTDEGRIPSRVDAAFHLIKSRLPMRSAVKIGASGLGHKKIRLVATILLSCIAFGLFGLADTFGAYNHVKTCTTSILDSGISYASVVRARKIGTGDRFTYWMKWGYKLSQNEIDVIGSESGVEMTGVYIPQNARMGFGGQMDTEKLESETDFYIYADHFTGYTEITPEVLRDMRATLVAGAMPDGGKNEIAVSTYVFESFRRAGYAAPDSDDYAAVRFYDDLVGKVLLLDGVEYTVTGIVDTGFDLSRYETLTEAKPGQSAADQLVEYALFNEFSTAAEYSMIRVAMTGEGHVDAMVAARAPVYDITYGWLNYWSEDAYVDPYSITTLDQVKDWEITWIGEEKTTLSENEILVTADAIQGLNIESYGDASVSVGYTTGEMSAEKLVATLEKATFEKSLYLHKEDRPRNLSGCKVVGILHVPEEHPEVSALAVLCDSDFEVLADSPDAAYTFAVGAMPEERQDVETFVRYCYEIPADATERLDLQNSVTYELDTVNSLLQDLSRAFLYIGIGFALFAALMLANFIGTSISYKKQDIGILRAIGSRQSDVFRIFFSESFIIAMINFVLSAAGVAVATAVINAVIRRRGILITVLSFGPRQLLLLLCVSVAVAAIASYIPVKRIASKRPIDAIRGR